MNLSKRNKSDGQFSIENKETTAHMNSMLSVVHSNWKAGKKESDKSNHLQCISCLLDGSPKLSVLLWYMPPPVSFEPYILIGHSLVVSYTFTMMDCLPAS